MPYAEWLPLLAPTWLQGPYGTDFLAKVGTLLDEHREVLVAAIQARMPDAAPEDALPVIGAERQLEQGPAELPPSYAERLKHAWEIWREAGSHGGMHRQLRVAGFIADKFIIQRSGRRSSISADLVSFAQGPRWDFDARPPAFYNQFGLLVPGDLPSVTWSSGAGFSTDAARLNRIVHRWRPAKAMFMGTWIVDDSAVWGWPTTRVWGGAEVWEPGTARWVPPQ